MTELNICPSTLEKGHSTYSPIARRKLFGGVQVSHILPYGEFTSAPELIEESDNNRNRMSLSGAQTKYSVLIDNGQLLLTEEGEQGTFILKPKLTDFLYPEASPANENLTMQIAEQVYKIPTAPNGLCFFKDGTVAYITKRYDVNPDGSKIQQEDFASLAGVTADNAGKNYKYDSKSYEDIASLIRKHIPAWRVELIKFYRLMLFNFLFANGDAHLKNFSVLMTPEGDYVLSPAYDLINTLVHLPSDPIFALQRGLFSTPSDNQGPVTGKMFHEFGIRIGLPEKTVKKELDKFCAEYADIDKLIENSYLPDKLKKTYRLIYRTRLVSYLQVR